MKISLNWIKDFVDLDGISVRDIWYKFTMSAAEVEDVIEMGKDIQGVVAGKIVGMEPHPSSPKLKICSVDTGNGVVQSVCGAPNAAVGMIAPFSPAGGTIRKASDKTMAKVEETEVYGIKSQGILCSSAEIGISDSHEGLLELPQNIMPGTDIKKIIAIEDVVIEIDNKSLTNRPDLWGHYGIAREMAAIFRRELKPMDIAVGLENKSLPELRIRIDDPAKCFRYSGIQIENIKVKTSPLNMQTRLYYCGMRPISAIVDLTNYLMMETGQPMHAFDKNWIDSIVVKSTEKPVKFTTLDGVERTIPEDVLMICNLDKPVGIAGIMGGENSEISAGTEAIILESANFEGASIRRSSTRLGLRTEASSRYEKMLDPNLTTLSIKRFVKLLSDMQQDIKITSNLTDIYVNPLKQIKIDIDMPYINKYIGNEIEADEVASILKSLEFGVEREGNRFTITVPSFRATKDISIKADIIEEISRIHGYDNIVPKTLEVALQPLDYNEDRLEDHRVRDILSEKYGFSEVNSYVWYNNTFNASIGIGLRGKVKLLNPHAKDMNILRDSMVPTMLEFSDVNRKFYDEFSIYEIGSVFEAPDEKSKCTEHKNLCALAASKVKSEDNLFYDLKGMVSNIIKLLKNIEPEFGHEENKYQLPWIHPVKSVSISVQGKPLGTVSVLHPQIRQAIDKKLNVAYIELNMTAIHELERKQTKYTETSRFPGVTLDFSFLADKAVRFDQIQADIMEYENKYLTGFSYVELYTGKGLPEGKKSFLFRFSIGSAERTLSSDDINEFSEGLLKHMGKKGYSLR